MTIIPETWLNGDAPEIPYWHVDEHKSVPAHYMGYESPKLIIPGSFNPVHIGHAMLAHEAAYETGMQPYFELSMLTFDKPPIEHKDLSLRIDMLLMTGVPILVTRAPLFVDKWNAFGNDLTFAIGYDTALRFVENTTHAVLEAMYDKNVEFYVAPRKMPGGEEKNVYHIHNIVNKFAPAYWSMFKYLHAEALPISSTAIRMKMKEMFDLEQFEQAMGRRPPRPAPGRVLKG